jgi:hypothetical protein
MLWEASMEHDFELCNLKSTDLMVSTLLTGRVAPYVYLDWSEYAHGRGLTREAPWEDTRKIFCARFLPPTEEAAKVDIPNNVTAMSSPSHAKEATVVVPMQTVSVAVTKPSEEKQPVVAKVAVCAKTTMDEVEPLSELNMQLKRVHDEACKPVDKGQRWSLFQT